MDSRGRADGTSGGLDMAAMEKRKSTITSWFLILSSWVDGCAIDRNGEDRSILGGKCCKDRTSACYILFLNKVL